MDPARRVIHSMLTEAEGSGWVFKQESTFRDQYRPNAFSGQYNSGIVDGDFMVLDADGQQYLVILWFASKEKGHTRVALTALRNEHELPLLADDVDNEDKMAYWDYMLNLGLIDGIYDEDHELVAGTGPESPFPDDDDLEITHKPMNIDPRPELDPAAKAHLQQWMKDNP